MVAAYRHLATGPPLLLMVFAGRHAVPVRYLEWLNPEAVFSLWVHKVNPAGAEAAPGEQFDIPGLPGRVREDRLVPLPIRGCLRPAHVIDNRQGRKTR